ncbi:hypothetical protein CROQUDRAFT_44873, partial [Cronartium quercuum f. sp. fusiforme G11]
VPGLYKIIDEILVNAADNKNRGNNINLVKLKIDAENGLFSVMNNRKGILIEVTILVTMTRRQAQGGKGVVLVKLANIYSKEFIVEIADPFSGKKYKQVFRKNMSIKEKPEITENKKGEEHTKISLKPDLARFSLPPESGIMRDMEALLSRRVDDMAGNLKDVKVWLNDERCGEQ